LNLSVVLDTATLYDAYASAYEWLGVKETGPNDDPDGDGLTNFIEFAFGMDPLSPSPANFTTLSDSGSGVEIQFSPVRDTSAVTYTVEFARDLDDWGTETPFVVATPAGQAVSVPLPAGDRGFGRVRPSI